MGRTNPIVVFCTTCKGRAQHVERTLPKNLADNADFPNCRFVLLDYSSQDHLADYLKQNHQKDIDSGRLIVYTTKKTGPFMMAHAKNMAHRLGIVEGGDILVNLDADNFTGYGFARYVMDCFSAPTDRLKRIYLWPRWFPGVALRRGTSGRIAVTADAFLLAGGYDEKYSVWSPDDQDFKARLNCLGFEGREIIVEDYLTSITHNDRIRFRDYRHARAEGGLPRGDTIMIKESDSAVANFGSIGVGLAYRNFGTDPVVISPVPTRIFGIGSHKTATTSLHCALEILGYNSAHWTTPRWARDIWEEMTKFGRSRTLERHYALCDLPISFLYRSLDIVYPGSKFILTVRNPDRWIESVRRHWDQVTNPFRDSWDYDCFTHRAHSEVYGRKSFDAETFLMKYQEHNAEVLSYFKDRSGDLLVMDMDSECDMWVPLCRFLGCPHPNVRYPQMNNMTGI